MSRRRQRADARAGADGDLIDNLIEIARHSPAIGLGLAAVLFAGGGILFWGDPQRWMGLAPIAGIPFLLLATMVAGVSLVFYLRDHVARRRREDMWVPPPSSERIGAQLSSSSAVSPAGLLPRDGLAFEKVVVDHFGNQGYVVEATGTHGRGGDRGVDLLLRRPDASESPRICVQCKDYAEWKVGAPAVREFAGAVRLRGPGHVGWLVTTGRFTAGAVRNAVALDLRLIDGDAWASMCRAAGATVPADASPLSPVAVPHARDVPRCPACHTPMVRRDPKPHGKQFRPFWGCSSFPRCRETVDIA